MLPLVSYPCYQKKLISVSEEWLAGIDGECILTHPYVSNYSLSTMISVTAIERRKVSTRRAEAEAVRIIALMFVSALKSSKKILNLERTLVQRGGKKTRGHALSQGLSQDCHDSIGGRFCCSMTPSSPATLAD